MGIVVKQENEGAFQCSINVEFCMYTLLVYMFRAIWEFVQSRDCVAHSRKPEIAQTISGLRNVCAISRSHAPARPTASIYCVARRMEDIPYKRHPSQKVSNAVC